LVCGARSRKDRERTPATLHLLSAFRQICAPIEFFEFVSSLVSASA
jgi:hypothetical protein